MEKFLTAKEARTLLERVNMEDTEILSDVISLIRKAIARHDDYIHYSKVLPEYVIRQLTVLGYHVGPVQKGDGCCPSYRFISF